MGVSAGVPMCAPLHVYWICGDWSACLESEERPAVGDD